MTNLTEISREIEFDAAHRLLDSPESKCFELHGHRYKLTATISGFVNQKGIVLDFGDLKDILMSEVHNELDHKFINLVMGETNATVERMLEWCWPRISIPVAGMGALLTHLTIHETPTCKAERSLSVEYLAGIIDGEGSISQSSGVEIQLRISNTNLGMLESIQDELGCGTIQQSGAPDKNAPVQPTKPCYNLVFSRRNARVLCAICLPFLRIKQEQAEICVSYVRYETGRSRLPIEEWNRRAEILTKLSAANGNDRVFTGTELQTQQDKFRENRRRSAAKSYQEKKENTL